MNGVLVIDKPAGFTSFDVIAVVRRLTGQRKTGHTGTLDPNATGVLPVLLGTATKAQDILPDHDKSYTAGFQLGLQTDTLDIWGKTLRQELTHVSEEDIARALERFRGDIMQVPPMVSAVKKDGRRLYELARKGIEVERAARPVHIDRLDLVCFDPVSQSGVLDIVCSRGTYVRALIDDLGRELGACAAMNALRRTAACSFTLDDSLTLDQLGTLAGNGQTTQVIRPVESLFLTYPAVCVSEAQTKRFCNGGALDIARTKLCGQSVDDGTCFRVCDGTGRFLGLAKFEETSGILKLFKLFERQQNCQKSDK